MCGLHKSQRESGGSATQILQKMFRCTVGGVNKNSKVAQKFFLKILKSIKKVDYVLKSLGNDLGIINDNIQLLTHTFDVFFTLKMLFSEKKISKFSISHKMLRCTRG